MIPSWVIGSAVASAVFMITVQLGILAIGMPGVLASVFVPFWIGWGVASTFDARWPKRDAVIIAVVAVGLLVLYLWQLQARLGVQGGPNLERF